MGLPALAPACLYNAQQRGAKAPFSRMLPSFPLSLNGFPLQGFLKLMPGGLGLCFQCSEVLK